MNLRQRQVARHVAWIRTRVSVKMLIAEALDGAKEQLNPKDNALSSGSTTNPKGNAVAPPGFRPSAPEGDPDPAERSASPAPTDARADSAAALMPTKSKLGGLSYLYDRQRWQNLRRHQLMTHPLCKFCLEQGKVEPATVADHIEPHNDNINKFWTGKLQSLCASCHSGAKQQIEVQGFANGCGVDGLPLDRNHPFYRKRA